LESLISLNTTLNSGEEIEMAVDNLTESIHRAAAVSTSPVPRIGTTYGIVLTREARELLTQKRRLRRRAIRSQDPWDRLLWNRAAKQLRNVLRELRSNFFEQKLASMDYTVDAGYSLWKCTKSLKRQPFRQVPIRCPGGELAKNEEEQANCFANHLETRFTHFQFATTEQYQETLDSLETPLQMSLPIKPIRVEEIVEAIKSLPLKKSPGIDNVCNATLKALPVRAILYLALIYNAILRVQFFPKQWKMAAILMIHKPGKPEESPESYRPISLLSSLSKLWERLIANRLNDIMTERRILPDHQFGFRQGHSTVEQVHRLTKHILQAFDDKEYCNAVFIDMQQAFDRVWHDGLISKVKKLFPAPYYGVLKSYLEDRRFMVRVRNSYSIPRVMRAGVPQGSVLGPLLYSVFTADLPCPNAYHMADPRKALLATYADDIALLYSSNCCNEAARGLQEYLTTLAAWCKRWNLKVNPQKTINPCFTLKTLSPVTAPIELEGVILDQPSQAKYLGITLDKRLTFGPHLKATTRRCYQRMQQLRWLLNRKSTMTLRAKRAVYVHCVAPIWLYGIQIWGIAAKSNYNRIQVLQNRAMRAITDCPYYVRGTTLHRDLNLHTVEEQISRHTSRYSDRLRRHHSILARRLLPARPLRRLKRKGFAKTLGQP